jgi:hypothetical protein
MAKIITDDRLATNVKWIIPRADALQSIQNVEIQQLSTVDIRRQQNMRNVLKRSEYNKAFEQDTNRRIGFSLYHFFPQYVDAFKDPLSLKQKINNNLWMLLSQIIL